jgi:hypothetical protein
MGLAAVAYHVVAAVGFLGWRRAGRARRGVHLHVLDRGQLFGGELSLFAARCAADKLAVPRLEAAATKGEAAFFANGQQVLGRFVWFRFGLAFRVVFVVVVVLFRSRVVGSLG